MRGVEVNAKPPNPEGEQGALYLPQTHGKTLIIAVTYTVEMGGGEKMEKLCILHFNWSSDLCGGCSGYLVRIAFIVLEVLMNSLKQYYVFVC